MTDGKRETPVILCVVEPVTLPGVKLDMSSQVLGLKYEDSAEKADKLTLTVDNAALDQFDYPIWRTGNIIYLRWGYPELWTVERKTHIRKVTGFRTLSIEAFGGELLLAKKSQTRTFPFPGSPAISRSQVAEVIAYEWGYRDPSARHIQPTEQTFEAIHQRNQTDLQFINMLKAEERYDFYISYDGFHFHSKEWLAAQTDYSPVKTLTYFSDRSEIEILDMSIENDITARPGSVGAGGWSPIERHGIYFTATHADQAKKDELAAILENPGMGEWDIAGMPHIGQHKTIHVPNATAENVMADAKNALLSAKSEAVKIKMTIIGDPTILAKHIIDVRGVGNRLSQRYWVRSVEHSIGAGYTCQLECISSGSHGHDTKVTTPIGVMSIQLAPANPSLKEVKRDSNGIQITGMSPEQVRQMVEQNAAKEKEAGEQKQREEQQKKAADKQSAIDAKRSADFLAAQDADRVKTEAELVAELQKKLDTLVAEDTARVQEASANAAAKTPKAPVFDQPVRKETPAVTVNPPAGQDTPAGVGDAGVAVPQTGAQANEIKTQVGMASQAQLDAAYASTEGRAELPESDSTRAYLYTDALVPGNIDLDHRPYVQVTDEEGNTGTATVYSMGYQPVEWSPVNVLVPCVSDDGRVMSGDEAIATYEQTGKHLGMYADDKDATAAGEKIHLDQVLNPPIDSLAVRKETPLTPKQRKQLQLSK